MYFDLHLNGRIAIFAMIALLAFVISICVALNTGFVSTDSNVANGVELPIIMYHSILKDNSLHSKYVVSPDEFEKDLNFIRDNGYSTVVVDDLVQYVYHDKALPEKPIMLTFDDGYYNNFHYVLPLLKKYGVKAVISPVMSVSEQYTLSGDVSVSYSYCTFDDIREMQSSGVIEFANHSYDLHSNKGRNGVSKINGESIELYNSVVGEDIKKAQDMLYDITGAKPVCMVYPFGAFCDESEALIKSMDFKASMICTSGMNIITKDVECLYKLRRFIRPPNNGIEQIINKE